MHICEYKCVAWGFKPQSCAPGILRNLLYNVLTSMCVILFLFTYCCLFLPFLATVECYNPRTNEWTYVAKMNEPHYGHAGTVYGGYMYISGTFHTPAIILYVPFNQHKNIIFCF